MIECLKRDVLRANLELSPRGLAILTWGNASAIDRASGMVVIKPSGVPYENLTEKSLVVVNLRGQVVAGDLKPSSDLASHLALYRAWPSIGGVVHTHSPKAVAFAQARRPVPCLGTTHADHFNGPVPLTRLPAEEDTQSDYERHTGELIVACLGRTPPLEMPAALVAGHGPFAWGRTVAEAVDNAWILEEIAAMALDTLALDPASEPLAGHLRAKHFNRKHGPGATYGQG